jgi:cysteine desulfurase/selenocysteine lyase
MAENRKSAVETTATSRWEDFRACMPVAGNWAYLDHAAVAPLPEPARQAISTWVGQAAEEGDTAWHHWARRMEEIRATAARLVNASPDEIALIPNTTTGISQVAEGLPWQAGDNVVTMTGEFPSNLYPWMHLADRGVEERRVALDGVAVDPNRIAATCDDRTRVVALSWVAYASGWRVDVAELAEVAHDHGALLFLDAIQGLGVFPLDVRATGVDFFAADGHKWMLGPEGAGFLFVRREHLDRLRPLVVGWNSVAHARDFDRIELRLRPAASRYEAGSQNMVGFHGLGASLDFLEGMGLSCESSPLADRVLTIGDYACDRLSRVGARIVSDRRDRDRHASGICCFEMPDRDPQAVVRQCAAERIALSCRHGRLRISPHAYNNEEDIDRLIQVLARHG